MYLYIDDFFMCGLIHSISEVDVRFVEVGDELVGCAGLAGADNFDRLYTHTWELQLGHIVWGEQVLVQLEDVVHVLVQSVTQK